MPNWGEVLTEIQSLVAGHQAEANNAYTAVRQKYINRLFNTTGRNVIAYYSGFLSKPDLQSDINDEDMNGFMMAVHKLNRKKGLDLILHTEGGNIASTQAIVRYLHQMFDKNIRAIVPQIAMSAGTMIACSCTEIWMGKHSSLGPIDPQLRGIPAAGVVREFERAYKEIKADPAKMAVWQPIIGQYRPTFLSQCENAIRWSNDFVGNQVRDVMFNGKPDAKRRAQRVVKGLADYQKNRTHERHISPDECIKMGLEIKMLENSDDMQDVVLTLHHCYMNLLMNTPAYKITENQIGTALIKQLTEPQQPPPQQRSR
jgi:ATP-dependent protease ClpP protease subunit